jgi:hypothetical protein
MRFLVRFLLLCLLPLAGWAQSSLQPCPSSGYKHNCFGSAVYPSGARYEGEFQENRPHGRGTGTFTDGSIYIGDFRDGQFHGQGTATFANGNKYVGEFKDGKRDGQGTATFANGNKYVGEFKDGKRNGQGTFTYANGGRHVGEFKDDKENGQGTYTFANGDKYVGEFKDGMFNGQGIFTHANRDTYVGEHKDDKRNGQGTYTFANGRKYVGEFKDDKYNGQGTLTFANGGRYVGEWRSGLRNGQGIEYRANGTIISSGQWADGRLTKSVVLDRNRFPFDGATQIATPTVDTGRAERDRLAAEAEAARRRQQELEAQLAALQSQSASRPSNQAAFSRNQRRVALVIGNAQYKVSPLDNPVNDATDVDQTLRQLGFQTTLVRNATLGQMREATRRFADQLGAADVALIYFAGHGIESNRKNYMIPVNANLKFEYELDDQAYNAGQWLDMLESIKSSNAERVNIVILDACRNNSLIGARSLGRGLGRMDAPTGTFLSFSTSPGKVADDGVRGERNSPFTKHLLSAMIKPNLPIEEAFKEVRRNVSRETNGAQVPWESTSLTGFFTFRQTR